jgi:hypothetical protein
MSCLPSTPRPLEVDALEGHEFIDGSMDRQEFRFTEILEWIRQHEKPLC